jgi:hypothetical protein
VFSVFSTNVYHGGCRGDTAQALDQWRHPVALSEALDVLYRVMCPASHPCIRMTIEITSDWPAFFFVADSLLPTNIAK